MSNNTNTNVGNNNSVLGSWALYSAANDTSCNSAFGTNSLLKHTTGSFNTSLGAGAMTFNITGNRNVAVGSSALEFNTNSENNTAIGTQALFDQREGSNNTAVGINAGLNDVSGSFNTYLGADTGTDTSVTPYNNSTAIGYGARIHKSNQIVLGTGVVNEEVYIPGKLFVGVSRNEITSSGGGGGGGSLSLNPETIDYLIGEFDVSGVPHHRVDIVFPKFNISLFTEFDLKITPRSLDYFQYFDPSMTETGAKKLLIDEVYLNRKIEVLDPNNKSGYNVNNGGCNVAIGAKSLSSVTKEDPSRPQLYNTAVGSFSQMSNTKGSENTSLGSLSLLKNREGYNNVGIGYLAGWNDISGNNNTYLGARTETTIPTDQGYYTTSTAIGSGATITNSNQIVLGTSNEKVYIPGQLWVGDTQITGSSLSSDQHDNTYVGKNTTLMGGIGYQGITRSTAIGYGADITLTNQIVLGTSAEFVCIPSNRGLSIGKTTEPVTGVGLDVSGSLIVSGDMNVNGTYRADSSSNIKIGGVTGKSISPKGRSVFRPIVEPTQPVNSIKLNIDNPEDDNSTIRIENTSESTDFFFNTYFLTSTTGFNIPGFNEPNSALSWSKNNSNLDNSIVIFQNTNITQGLSSDNKTLIYKINNNKTNIVIQHLDSQGLGGLYKKDTSVQTINFYTGIGTTRGGDPVVPTSPSEYIYLQDGSKLQLVASIIITPFSIFPSNSTYLGENIKYLSDIDTSKSTAIGYGSYIDVANQIVLGTSGEFVCIPSNRGLSIGKTTASTPYALDVSGSINFLGGIYKNGEPFVSGTSSSSNNNSITGPLFVSGDISGNGKLYVTGDISGNGKLYVSGDISGNGKLDITGDISGNSNLSVRGSVGASSYNATSDYRIKDNVRNLDEQDTISNLRPVKYFNNQTNKNDFGLIAHELQSEYPDLVCGEKDGAELQSVNYIGLISVLIKEVQELKRITAAQGIEISTFKKG